MALKRRPKPKKSLYRHFVVRGDKLEAPSSWSLITLKKKNLVGNGKT